jgi:predicted nucleic acid-binding protein
MLLDTSGLFCLFHGDEPYHVSARAAYKASVKRLTHSYVLAEFIALAEARHLPRLAALQYVQDLLFNPRIEVVWVDRDLNDLSMGLLFKRLDKTYSLCDAVSFVLMRQRGLTEALTTDGHFEQEGFRKLLGDRL